MTKIAAAQMVSVDDVEVNLTTAARLIRRAAEQDVKLVALPENFAYLGKQEGETCNLAEHFGVGKIQDFLAEQALRHDLWILAGTVPIRAENDLQQPAEKIYAASLVYNAHGECVTRYDKIHLFDVILPGDAGEKYTESASYHAGDKLVVAPSPCGRLGLSVCYDLRFPELYRGLVDKGAEILSVPAAFTQATGKVHWDILLKARAVENQCYLVAAAQGGLHPGGRRTFGASQVIDPWGEVLVRLGEGEGLAVAEIDLQHLKDIRERFPALAHRRLPIND